MTKNIFALMTLTIFATLMPPKAHAQTSETDVIQVWLQTRFQNCDAEFADIIHTQFFNKAKLRSIAAGDCAGAPQISSPECISAADQALAPKFAARALKEGGCQNNPKFGAASNTTPSPTAAAAPDANVICNSKSSYKFSRQVGSQICRQRFDCDKNFSYLGKSFDSGTYEFTCHADRHDSCDNIHIGDVSCLNPTIQSIGIILNGDVQKFPSPAAGAQ